MQKYKSRYDRRHVCNLESSSRGRKGSKAKKSKSKTKSHQISLPAGALGIKNSNLYFPSDVHPAHTPHIRRSKPKKQYLHGSVGTQENGKEERNQDPNSSDWDKVVAAGIDRHSPCNRPSLHSGARDEAEAPMGIPVDRSCVPNNWERFYSILQPNKAKTIRLSFETCSVVAMQVVKVHPSDCRMRETGLSDIAAQEASVVVPYQDWHQHL